MLPGERENIQKENDNSELNVPQEEQIHYIKIENIGGVKKREEVTKEEYKAIKKENNPYQEVKKLNHKQWLDAVGHQRRWADPNKRQKKVNKARARHKEKCYYKETTLYGLKIFKEISELEYRLNKDQVEVFFEGSYIEYIQKRDLKGQTYTDKKGNSVPKDKYQKMTEEERSKLNIEIRSVVRERKNRLKKQRKKDYNDNNNNNNNNNQQTIPTQLDEERNLPQSSPVVSSANAEQPENPHAFQDNSVETSENQKNIENIEINNLVARFPQFAEFRFSVNFNRTHAASQNINNNNQNNDNQNNGYEIYEP